MQKHKFYLTANLQFNEETEELRKEVASVIKLPTVGEKQPDLQYFSAIFVSSGENLNHAYFLGSELVAASDSIISKALDVEHDEKDIIGHIFSKEFTDKEGNKLDLESLVATETASLDAEDMHIQIGAIVYKNRFPELAKEIANDKWKVSMECYFTDFDIKVGDLILSKDEAQVVGVSVVDDGIFGKKGKVIKDGKEIATGTVARVLRGICFSGCGIVKNPANPPSVILETASDSEEDIIVFDVTDKKQNRNDATIDAINVTSKEVRGNERDKDIAHGPSIGTCVSYKRRIEDKEGNIIHENWCSAYDHVCTSSSRDVSDKGCLINKVKLTANSYLFTLLNNNDLKNKTADLLDNLQSILNKAKNFVD